MWSALPAGTKPSRVLKVRAFVAKGIFVLWVLFFVAVIVIFAVPLLLAWIAPEAEWSYRWQNALDSELTDAVVTVAHRPHDCEFMTAPLGDKHCHYERHVDTIRVHDSGSGPEVSYDNGHSWSRTPSPMKPAILVSWTKVED
jgi:hypothetical protein